MRLLAMRGALLRSVVRKEQRGDRVRVRSEAMVAGRCIRAAHCITTRTRDLRGRWCDSEFQWQMRSYAREVYMAGETIEPLYVGMKTNLGTRTTNFGRVCRPCLYTWRRREWLRGRRQRGMPGRREESGSRRAWGERKRDQR